MRTLTLLLVTIVTTSHAAIVSTRSDYFGLPGSSSYTVVADFDGDGLDEIATFSARQTSFHPLEFGTSVAIAGRLPGGGWGQRSVIHLDARLTGSPRVWRRTGGAAIVFRSEAFDPLAGYGYHLRVLAGIPLRHERSIALPPNGALAAVGDIDADGDADWVESGPEAVPPYGQQLRVFDLATGIPVWARPVPDGNAVKAAQLDSDAPLEILLSGAVGRIIDGATGNDEWTYAGGFSGRMLTGNFDAEPTTMEFTSFVGSSVVVFGTEPYTPLADYPIVCCGNSADAGDIDGDGSDEMVFTSVLDTQVLDPVDGSVQRYDHESYGGENVAIGDVDPSADAEIVRSGSFFSGRGNAAFVHDADTFDVLQRLASLPSGPLRVSIAELDSSPGQEVVLGVPEYLPYGERLELRSLATGALLRSVHFPNLGDAEEFWRSEFRVGQWDGDPALEIGATVQSNVGSEFHVFDSATLATQARFLMKDPHLADLHPLGVQVADLDADGSQELVAIHLNLQESTFRVQIFDAQTGAIEWRSTPLLRQDGRTPTAAVHVAQLDADPALEIMAWTGTQLYVFDGTSHVLQDSRTFATENADLFVAIDAQSCRLGVFDASGLIRTGGCNDTELSVGPTLDGTVRWARYADELGGGFLAAVDDRVVHVSQDGNVVEPLATGMGWHLGEFQGGIAVTPNDTGMTLVAANDGALKTVELLPNALFGDGFGP